jgi:pimeloyl-ACP methyl ester carboxylesterase
MHAMTVIGAVLGAAVSMLPAGPVVAAQPESLQWGACPDAGVSAPGLECATLDVPLDYRNPGGTTIEIALSRLAATKPGERRGVLLTNPGGPGGSGLAYPLGLVDLGLPAAVRESYDLIGFDPRGVGHSTPVTCDLPPELRLSNIPPYARGPADVERQAQVARGIASGCAGSATAPILPHITTANTARDMDRIRAALGEPRISYYGLSYGTYLGAVYATMFGDRTDRIVLDSAFGTGGLDVTASRRLGEGFRDRFPDFAGWAAARHDSYGLGRTPGQVTTTYFALAHRLDRASSSGVDGALFRLATFNGLYSDAFFPDVAQLWQAVSQQEPQAAQPGAENLLAAQLHVTCNDSDWPESVRTYQVNVAVDRIRHPMFGAATANIWPCAFWPTDPVKRPVRIDDRGPSNILVVQNLRDPATPLAGARELRAALGQRTRFVTVDQGGHGVYLAGTNTCGNDTVTRFLATGERPPGDSHCPANAP